MAFEVVDERAGFEGEKEQLKPVEGVPKTPSETEAERTTVSVKPFTPFNVIVELARVPAGTVALVGFATIVKSVGITWKKTLTERDRPLTVPATVAL